MDILNIDVIQGRALSRPFPSIRDEVMKALERRRGGGLLLQEMKDNLKAVATLCRHQAFSR